MKYLIILLLFCLSFVSSLKHDIAYKNGTIQDLSYPPNVTLTEKGVYNVLGFVLSMPYWIMSTLADFVSQIVLIIGSYCSEGSICYVAINWIGYWTRYLLLDPLRSLLHFMFIEMFRTTYELLYYIFKKIWDIIVAIGLEKLATTILINIGRISYDILQLVFDIIKLKLETLGDIIQMLWNFFARIGLAHFLVTILEGFRSAVYHVLDFLMKNTINIPIRYYAEYIVTPTFEV